MILLSYMQFKEAFFQGSKYTTMDNNLIHVYHQ